MSQHHRLIVLGSGPAGYTAALYAARANLKPALVTGIEVGGQLTTTTEVENWPGGHAALQGPELMMQMAEHVERFDATIINDQIDAADLSMRPFEFTGDQGRYTSDALIIANRGIGPLPRPAFGGCLQGPRGERLRHLRRLFLPRPGSGRNRRRQHGGGGGALPVQHRQQGDLGASARRDAGGEDPAGPPICPQQHRAGLEPHLGRSAGRPIRRHRHTHPFNLGAEERRIDLAGVFIAIGHTPNTGIFEGQLDMDGGYIKVSSGLEGNATATSVPGVFAAGDVADQIYRQAVTSAGFGCMAALDAEKYLDALD